MSTVQHCDHLAWEERAGLCVSRAFVCLFCTRINVCPFSLPTGVMGLLRRVIVALAGHFY